MNSLSDFRPFNNPMIIAELSANHGKDLNRVFQLIDCAIASGANAIKLQTFTPDTITLDSDSKPFQITGNNWEGQTLYELYRKAYLPWDLHQDIFNYCSKKGIICFSTPFDFSAVDFLEELGTPIYKIASSELVDIPLIEYVALTGKPTIISTGMATEDEISEAVVAFLKHSDRTKLTLLKCTAEYPARPEDANVLAMQAMGLNHRCNVGLSDHTMTPYAALAAVCLGASVIEKHITLSRTLEGPDSHFSLEPNEFAEMTDMINKMIVTFGRTSLKNTDGENISQKYRKSLFCKSPLNVGDVIALEHIAIVRPANGLHPRHHSELIGKVAKRTVGYGDPFVESDLGN